MLCARPACAKPAAEQMIDAASKQVIAHVCSQQCGYALIGMPKRAAEDDAAQEETPHQRAIKTARNVAKLAMILERIAKLEEDVRDYLNPEYSNPRMEILTRLQIRIGAGITPTSSVLEKLVEIRDNIIDTLQDAARGFDVDYDAIRAGITSLSNQLADDETLERYLYVHDPVSLRNLLPMDTQRIIARRTFPIQIVSQFQTPLSLSNIFSASADTDSIQLFFKQNDMILTTAYHFNGERFDDLTIPCPRDLLNAEPSTLLVRNGSHLVQSQTYPLRRGTMFALEPHGTWGVVAPGTIFFVPDNDERPRFYSNNAATGLVKILMAPPTWRRHVAHCFVRNNIVAIVDQSKKVRVFDLENDTQTTLTKLRLPDIDSVAIDDKSHIWISHQTSLAVFTIADEEITTDNLAYHTTIAISSPDFPRPSFLTAAGPLVWLAYQVHSFSNQHTVQVYGLRLTPELLLA